jgi:hypothetical protein
MACENSLDAVRATATRDRVRRLASIAMVPCRGWPKRSPVDEPQNSASSIWLIAIDRLIDHAAEHNPDTWPSWRAAEQPRGRFHLMGLLTLMKGKPLTYNKDTNKDLFQRGHAALRCASWPNGVAPSTWPPGNDRFVSSPRRCAPRPQG